MVARGDEPDKKGKVIVIKPNLISNQRVKFIDIFHGEEHVDFVQVKAAGYSGVFHKATEGISVVDKTFSTRWPAIIKAGIQKRGAYHFLHPAKDPVVQADFFLRTVGPLDRTDALMCDWEVTDGVMLSQQKSEALAFKARVEQVAQRECILYSYEAYLDEAKCGEEFAHIRPWIAQYIKSLVAPVVPPPFETWAAWQYTGDGFGNTEHVAGVGDKVDVSYFNGSIAEFIEWGAKPL